MEENKEEKKSIVHSETPNIQENPAPVKGYEPKELKDIFNDIKAYVNKKPTDKNYTNLNFKLGLAGGILAIVGAFCPVFTVLLLGDISLLNAADLSEGGFFQTIIYATIGLGILGIICSSKRLYHMNIIIGIFNLCLYLLIYIGLKGEVGEADAAFVRISWGWLLLIASPVCLILSRTYKENKEKEEEK